MLTMHFLPRWIAGSRRPFRRRRVWPCPTSDDFPARSESQLLKPSKGVEADEHGCTDGREVRLARAGVLRPEAGAGLLHAPVRLEDGSLQARGGGLPNDLLRRAEPRRLQQG